MTKSREELQKAQATRVRRYGIGAKAKGHLSPPKGYPENEAQYGDPVNYRYPIDEEHRQAALSYFNQRKNQAAGGYSAAEWGKIGRRIAKALGSDYQYDAESKTVVRREEEADVEQSLDQLTAQMRRAFQVQFPSVGGPVAVSSPSYWVMEIYEDYVVIIDEATNRYYKVAYTEGEEGIIFASLPEWEEVKREEKYVSVREAVETGMEPVEGAEGREWEVAIIGAWGADDTVMIDGQEALRSANGRFYLVEALAGSVKLWDGVKVFDNHLTDEEFAERQGMRSVANEWIGTIVRPFWDGVRRQVRGILKVVEEGLAKKLLAAYEAGVLNSVGLSIDAFVEGREVEFEGETVGLVERIVKALSVDVVANPAAGGGFVRLIASESQNLDGGAEMNEEELRALVEELVGGLGESLQAQVAEAVAAAMAARAEEAGAAAEDEGESESSSSPNASPREGESEAEPGAVAAQEAARLLEEARAVAAELVQTARLQQCQAVLETRLTEAGLPDGFSDMIRERFSGRVFEAEELEGEIEAQRQALIRLSESGRVRGLGLRPVREGVSPNDLLYYRALATFGMREEIPEDFRSAEAWRGIRDMYIELTGDREFYGRFYADRVTEANVTSTVMASTVANVLNKILVNAFFRREQWWDPLVVNRDLEKFQDMRLVSLYGFSTLSTVGEGAAYTELTWDDYYETASISKKGNYVGVTLEMMMKDDLDTVRRIPEGLGAAAYNTVADLVSAFFTDNAGIGPTLTTTSRALWNGTEGNLLTSALSFANFDTAAATLMGFTEPGSSRGLGLMPGFLMVPTELYTLGRRIQNSEQLPGSADNDVNPWYQQFETVRVPTWTDAENWALIAKPEQFEGLVLGWLFGRREPEIFVADNEMAGAMFTNDEMRVKIRFFVCAGVTDWRLGVKSNV